MPRSDGRGRTGLKWPQAALSPAPELYEDLCIQKFMTEPATWVLHLTLLPVGSLGESSEGPDLDNIVSRWSTIFLKSFMSYEKGILGKQNKIFFFNGFWKPFPESFSLNMLTTSPRVLPGKWWMTNIDFSMASVTWDRRGNLCKYIQESCLGSYLFHLTNMLLHPQHDSN